MAFYGWLRAIMGLILVAFWAPRSSFEVKLLSIIFILLSLLIAKMFFKLIVINYYHFEREFLERRPA